MKQQQQQKQQQSQLSKYLQKYILNLIITYLNNKKINLLFKNEKEDDLFLNSLYKVCWYWFSVIKEKTTIIPYNQLIGDNNISKYSIYQKDNIKYCYLNNDDIKSYSPSNSISKLLPHSFINCPNLKRFILNIDYNYNKHAFEIINQFIKNEKPIIKISIKNQKNNENNNINNKIIINKVKNLEINNIEFIDWIHEGINDLIPFLNNLKMVSKFNIYSKYFQQLFKYIYDDDDSNKIVELHLKKALLKTKEFKFISSPLSIDELFCLLKLSPNLKSLDFEICYDNLIYKLEKMNGDEVSNCKYCSNNNNKIDNQLKFNQQWEFISNSIINSKSLINFNIQHRCPYFQYQFQPIGQFETQNELPINSIQSIGTIFKNNKSIKSLTLNSFHTPQIIEFIYDNNDDDGSSSYKKSIKVLQSSFIVNNQIDNISKFNNLKKQLMNSNKDVTFLFNGYDEMGNLNEEYVYQYID